MKQPFVMLVQSSHQAGAIVYTPEGNFRGFVRFDATSPKLEHIIGPYVLLDNLYVRVSEIDRLSRMPGLYDAPGGYGAHRR